jgi:glutathione S-transferase
MTHALAIIYAQWFAEEEKEAIKIITEKASVNVQKDLDEIENALSGEGPFICGNQITAADLALAFSCEYVLTKQVGTKGHSTNWPKIHQWLRTLEQRPAYQKALKEGPKYDFCLLKNEVNL